MAKDQKAKKGRFYTRAQLVLRETWRTAFRRGSLTLKLPTAAKAHKLRFELYTVVRAEKHGESDDFELTNAAETLEIILGEDKATLIMRPKSENEAYAAIAEATGITLENVQDPLTARAAEDSLKKLNERLKSMPDLATEHQENQFFGKRPGFKRDE